MNNLYRGGGGTASQLTVRKFINTFFFIDEDSVSKKFKIKYRYDLRVSNNINNLLNNNNNNVCMYLKLPVLSCVVCVFTLKP